MLSPDFDRFRTVLLRSGEPDYVPLANCTAMCQTTVEYGRYPISVEQG